MVTTEHFLKIRPFRLLYHIYSRGGGVDVDLMTPEIFNARVRKALRADANHLELPLLSPHFYCFGIQYLDLWVSLVNRWLHHTIFIWHLQIKWCCMFAKP